MQQIPKKLEETKKFDDLKPRISIVPQLALMEVIKGFEYGAKKYGEFNYSNGLQIRRYIDASWRHTNQFLMGEDVDKEAQVHHLALVACNALMALENLMSSDKDRLDYIDNRNILYKIINKTNPKKI